MCIAKNLGVHPVSKIGGQILLRSLPNQKKGKQGKNASTCAPEHNENARRPLASETVLLLDDLIVRKVQYSSTILRITCQYNHHARYLPERRTCAPDPNMERALPYWVIMKGMDVRSRER